MTVRQTINEHRVTGARVRQTQLKNVGAPSVLLAKLQDKIDHIDNYKINGHAKHKDIMDKQVTAVARREVCRKYYRQGKQTTIELIMTLADGTEVYYDSFGCKVAKSLIEFNG